MDPQDGTIEETALREFHEELGLDARPIARILGKWHDITNFVRSESGTIHLCAPAEPFDWQAIPPFLQRPVSFDASRHSPRT